MPANTILPISHNASLLGVEGAWKMQANANALDARLAGSGKKVVHLEIGQPDFPTPPHIVEAGIRSLQRGETRYTTPEGIPALREAIVSFVGARGVISSPDNIIATPGGKAALYCAMVSILNEGDDVLIPDPGFPIYPSLTRALGAREVRYPVSAAHGVTADAIRSVITDRCRMLILNAPHNPTGSSIADLELERIAELALERGLWIASDEVYATLQFDGVFRSIASVSEVRDRCVIVDSLSKSHVMTGWRIGYALMPPSLREVFTKVVVNAYSCTTTFVQHAAVAALTESQQCVADMRDEYCARTRLVSSQLNAMDGITCAESAGAFYVFPDVSELMTIAGASDGIGTTAYFTDRILDEALVALIAGTDFGAKGAGHVRVSCANSRENLQLAVDRIGEFARSVREDSPAVRA